MKKRRRGVQVLVSAQVKHKTSVSSLVQTGSGVLAS